MIRPCPLACQCHAGFQVLLHLFRTPSPPALLSVNVMNDDEGDQIFVRYAFPKTACDRSYPPGSSTYPT